MLLLLFYNGLNLPRTVQYHDSRLEFGRHPDLQFRPFFPFVPVSVILTAAVVCGVRLALVELFAIRS